MQDLKNKIAQLLNKTVWTDQEKQWLLKYLENTDTEELRHLMQQQFEDEKNPGKQVDREVTKKMLQRIHERIGADRPVDKAPILRLWMLGIAAAAVLGFIALGTYSWLKQDRKKAIAVTPVKNKTYNNEVSPGGNKAVLTLADGSTIVLDDAPNGSLIQQGNTKVVKLNGKLAYNATNEDPNAIAYNKIATPRGGQYQVELTDGSIVWLNAASSLYFPTGFVGKERRVEVTGEAYFEVAKNTTMPFTVKVNDAEIRVLGTHFNVMAYEDEAALTTTLLEGKVNFVNEGVKSLLKPGQQSQLKKNGQVKVISGVDVDEVVAWKNGIFDFEGVDIVSITNQLSRWYDVEIVNEKSINDLFYAKIPRNTRLTDVLKALELTGKVHFKIEGRKIIVFP